MRLDPSTKLMMDNGGSRLVPTKITLVDVGICRDIHVVLAGNDTVRTRETPGTHHVDGVFADLPVRISLRRRDHAGAELQPKHVGGATGAPQGHLAQRCKRVFECLSHLDGRVLSNARTHLQGNRIRALGEAQRKSITPLGSCLSLVDSG